LLLSLGLGDATGASLAVVGLGEATGGIFAFGPAEATGWVFLLLLASGTRALVAAAPSTWEFLLDKLLLLGVDGALLLD
jgi:hypothetical protein